MGITALNQPQPFIVSLDPALTTASAKRETGAGFGLRIGHSITRHVLAEFTLDAGQGHMAITSGALSAIEAMRATYLAYFNSILNRNPNTASVSTTSTATIANNVGKQLLVGADAGIAIVMVGGVQRHLTPRTGIRGDVRGYLRATDMTVRVDTDPIREAGTRPARIVRGPGPQLQFSTLPGVPSSLSMGINHVDTYTTFLGRLQEG